MSDELKGFAEQTFEKIQQKMSAVVLRNTENIPYTSIDGRFNDYRDNICKWTNGFWAGLLWLMYRETGESIYRGTAERAEQTLDHAFREFDGLHHDVGFMWHISAGLDYRLTGNPQSRVRALIAANLLAGRFNVEGNYIRAWNERNNEQNIGWAIIDSMMNLALLYWASEETGDPRFSYIAVRHANKTMKHHLRGDGSCRHIVVYDPKTGEELDNLGGQGYEKGSSWSRGQAWGLYGFTISYEHTKDMRYLDAARKIANYFICCVRCTDWLPLCDFRSPKEPVIYDSTAGAIAASGLLELSRNVPETEREMYESAAGEILKAMEKHFCDWDMERDGILQMGTERYHGEAGRHIPIIYGDYYFIEAITKLKGNIMQIW